MKHQSHNSRATNQSSATILCKHTYTHSYDIDWCFACKLLHWVWKKKFARIHFVCHSTAEKINKKLHTKLIILDNNAFCIFEGLKKKVIYYFTQKQPSCAHPLFIIRNRINYFFNWLSGIFFLQNKMYTKIIYKYMKEKEKKI